MANGARQERQLMRQRGAGSRQINNVDFGFAFSTPGNFRRSRTRSQTPQTVTRNGGYSLKKSKDAEIHPINNPASSTRSTRRARSADLNDNDGRTSNLGRPPSKRRRLSEISNLSNVTNIVPTLHIAKETIHEAEDARVDRVGRGRSGEIVEGVNNRSRDALDEDKENDVNLLFSNQPGFKRRKRKSIGQQKTKKKRPSVRSSTTVQTDQEPQLDAQDEQGERLGDGANSFTFVATQEQDVALRGSVDLHAGQATEPSVNSSLLPKEKRKKKSLIFTRKKRKSAGSTHQTPASICADYTIETPISREEQRRDDRSDSGFGDGHEQAGHDTHSDVEVLIHDRAKKSDHNQDEDQSEDSEASDQEYHPDDASPGPTPAPNRTSRLTQPKQRTKIKLKNSSARDREGKGSIAAFPVLTHRITNVQQLPTIHEALEAEETNVLGVSVHPLSFTTRDGPNAVDVVAQICRETIDSTITGLQTQLQTNGTSKASVKQRLEALQTFRAELESRLFDVSQSLDQRLQLEARLRKSRREKTSVQAQWLEVRKRRDQIALRIDTVRRRHWENEVVAKKAWEASDAAMRLEAEIQRSRDDGEEEQVDVGQFEIMLRNLAGDVSSMNGGGILHKLRGFNAQLERFAGSFEGQ